MPSLTALLSDAARQVRRDERPFGRAMLVHQLHHTRVFLGCPRTTQTRRRVHGTHSESAPSTNVARLPVERQTGQQAAEGQISTQLLSGQYLAYLRVLKRVTYPFTSVGQSTFCHLVSSKHIPSIASVSIYAESGERARQAAAADALTCAGTARLSSCCRKPTSRLPSSCGRRSSSPHCAAAHPAAHQQEWSAHNGQINGRETHADCCRMRQW